MRRRMRRKRRRRLRKKRRQRKEADDKLRHMRNTQKPVKADSPE